MTARVSQASKADVPAIRRLVEEAELPVADLGEISLSHWLVAAENGSVVGTVALQPLDTVTVLLRSLTVTHSLRGRGIGRQLMSAAEGLAVSEALTRCYLLTTTAVAFFESLGYSVCPRASVPMIVRSTREYSSLCPADATVMHKRLV